MEYELSDEQCDRLTAKLMDKLAAKHGYHATNLNPDIMAHHTLRRGLVRVAYELGKATAQPLSRAALDVITERRRQIEAEGYTPEHDDDHDDCALACAAACYAFGHAGLEFNGHSVWPGEWGVARIPAHEQRLNLVKAGALILAEIERLDRL